MEPVPKNIILMTYVYSVLDQGWAIWLNDHGEPVCQKDSTIYGPLQNSWIAFNYSILMWWHQRQRYDLYPGRILLPTIERRKNALMALNALLLGYKVRLVSKQELVICHKPSTKLPTQQQLKRIETLFE